MPTVWRALESAQPFTMERPANVSASQFWSASPANYRHRILTLMDGIPRLDYPPNPPTQGETLERAFQPWYDDPVF